MTPAVPGSGTAGTPKRWPCPWCTPSSRSCCHCFSARHPDLVAGGEVDDRLQRDAGRLGGAPDALPHDDPVPTRAFRVVQGLVGTRDHGTGLGQRIPQPAAGPGGGAAGPGRRGRGTARRRRRRNLEHLRRQPQQGVRSSNQRQTDQRRRREGRRGAQHVRGIGASSGRPNRAGRHATGAGRCSWYSSAREAVCRARPHRPRWPGPVAPVDRPTQRGRALGRGHGPGLRSQHQHGTCTAPGTDTPAPPRGRGAIGSAPALQAGG